VTVVSRRHLPALTVCLALTCAAVWTLALRAQRWERCADPAALADLLEVPGTATAAPGQWQLGDGNFLWVSGKLEPGPIGAFSYRMVRSDRASLLFTNWVSSIDFPMDPGEISSAQLDVDGDAVPIHVARAHVGSRTHVAVYLAVYDGRPVSSLLPHQIAAVPPQILHGTLPLTLYAVDGFSLPGDEALVEGPAREWLAGAWRRHREMCTP